MRKYTIVPAAGQALPTGVINPSPVVSCKARHQLDGVDAVAIRHRLKRFSVFQGLVALRQWSCTHAGTRHGAGLGLLDPENFS